MSDVLTAREAAAHLGVSLNAFYKWRRKCGIPVLPGMRMRVRRSDIERAFQSTARVVDIATFAREVARRA